MLLRMGYSVAGAAKKVLVRGCGDLMVGVSLIKLSAMGARGTVRLGPVRAADGRICSKPSSAATFSIDFQYCLKNC